MCGAIGRKYLKQKEIRNIAWPCLSRSMNVLIKQAEQDVERIFTQLAFCIVKKYGADDPDFLLLCSIGSRMTG